MLVVNESTIRSEGLMQDVAPLELCVSFNKGALHTTNHLVIFHTEPNNYILKFENFDRKCKKKHIYKPKNRQRQTQVSKDSDYGENAQKPDMRNCVFK